MAVYSNVEIEYTGKTKSLDEHLIVSNKYQERDDEHGRVSEYFIFTAQTIDSATITYDTGSDDEDWNVSIELVKITNYEKTFAFVVDAPYNTSLSENSRTITIDGTMHMDRNIGPHAECHLSFKVKNECPAQEISYVLSEEYVNPENAHYFFEFLTKNLSTSSNDCNEESLSIGCYDGFWNDYTKSKIYKIVARGHEGVCTDSDFEDYDADSLIPSASMEKRYYIDEYEEPDYKRIIDKENVYDIGTGLRSYGNSVIKGIEDVYNPDTKSGILYLPSVLHSVGYKAFSFCKHIHSNNEGEGSTLYFGNDILSISEEKKDLKSYYKYQREFMSDPSGNTNVTGFLKEIRLPDTAKIIGNQAFKYCTSLDTIEANNVEIIGMYAFEGCKSLTTWSFPRTKIRQIGEGAFKNSGLTGLTLGESTTIFTPDELDCIEAETFRNCTSLGTIDLRNTKIKKIGKWAFARCGADLSNTKTEISFDYLGDSNTAYLEIIAEGAFMNGNIDGLYVPKSVKHIEKMAFYGAKINHLEFCHSNEIIELGDKAFNRVEITGNGEGIELNERFNSIPYQGFYSVKAAYIRIGSSITSIGDEAFRHSDIDYIQFDGNGDTMPSYSSEKEYFVKCNRCRLKASRAFIDNVIAKKDTNRLCEILYDEFVNREKYDVIN